MKKNINSNLATRFANNTLLLILSRLWRYISSLAKANAYNTFISPQAAYRSCSGAVHVTDTRCTDRPYRLSMLPQTDLRPTNHRPPWSAF